MQDYDESFFIAKANKRASITWFVLLLIASVFYGIKVGRGQLKEAYFAGFFVAGWLSYLGGRILLRFKHADSLRYKLGGRTWLPDILCGNCVDIFR